MKQLAQREDQIMQVIWRLKKVFIREIIDELPDPKPHYNTVATIVKILVKKEFLGSQKLGNTHQYFPLIALKDYRDMQLRNIKKKYFEDSLPRMMAHFAKEEQLSEVEIKEILRLVKSDKKSKM